MKTNTINPILNNNINTKILLENQLKILVRETVKETIGLEFIKLRAFLLPYVSQEEQEEIEKLYRKPSKKSFKNYQIKI